MRLSTLFINAAALLLAAGLSVVAAGFSVTAIETRSEIGVRMALDDAGHDWAEVQADGLKVILSGTAPDEAAWFSVLSTAGSVVDAARIIDTLQITPSAAIIAPRFSVEILRNDSGISIIGLIPANSEREDLIRRLGQIGDSGHVSDLLQEAHYPVPRGWQDAIDYATNALEGLARSKISVAAGQVSITAIADSTQAKQALENRLMQAKPPGLALTLNITAPRPIFTPFTLRYLIDGTGGRFDVCSADSEAARSTILNAADKAGLTGEAKCVVGMGSPSASWDTAAAQAIAALARIGEGSVTMSDADITLVAAQGTNPVLFDRVVGELDSSLPQVFVLRATLPEPADKDGEAGPPEFTATLSPEGMVQLRGRLSDENLRDVADAYARARFGSESVYTATRLVDGLPPDWPVRVLAGLDSLALLVNGAVTVTPDAVRLKGLSEREEASAEIAALLADKLGGAGSFSLDITYRQPRAPVEIAPAPETCEADLAAVQATSKISFEPGSATIAEEAEEALDSFADILLRCGDIRLEIQGHTDSQGRETMNQQLSQARADAVLNALRARRVPTSTYTAIGYGETQPIADNATEAGRESNRRIAFVLILPELVEDSETALEGIATDLADPAQGQPEAQDPHEAAKTPDAGTAPAPAGDGEEPHDQEHSNAQSDG